MVGDRVTVYLSERVANDDEFGVDDGEEFLTAGKFKTTGGIFLYKPDREPEFVVLFEDQVEKLDSDRVKENSVFKVWGEKEAWDNTPSPPFNI